MSHPTSCAAGFLVLLSLAPGCSHQINKPPANPKMVGIANLTCFEIQKDSFNKENFYNWVNGYISGINKHFSVVAGGYWDISKGISPNQIFNGVNGYCENHPNEIGSNVANSLVLLLVRNLADEEAAAEKAGTSLNVNDSPLTYIIKIMPGFELSESASISHRSTLNPYVPGQPVIDQYGRPTQFVPNDGGGGVPLGPITPNAYGPGIHMDATGRPLKTVPWP